MIINIQEDLIPFVEKSALSDGITQELWVERKINANIKRLIKDQAIEHINLAQTDEVTRYTTAFETVKAEIVAEKSLIETEKIASSPAEATTTEDIII